MSITTTQQGRRNGFQSGGAMEHWKVLPAIMVGWQEKSLNSRHSTMAKAVTFWPWWQPFNSFCFQIISFVPLFPFFLFTTQKSGGGGWGPWPPSAPLFPWYPRPCTTIVLIFSSTAVVVTAASLLLELKF